MIKEAMLYEKIQGNKVHCFLCSHHCKILPSRYGICGVRENRGGVLFTHVYAEPVAVNVDPIEKKPFYHFLPGSNSYSIATQGCNFQCGFCQNWQISQARKQDSDLGRYELSPQDVVREAVKSRSRSISYTYTEPTIFFEYAYDTARLAKEKGIYNNFVTNGYMSRQALEAISPFLDAANVDLKSFREEFYAKICKAHLQPVLESIKLMRQLNIWVEVTTLVIPEINDSEEELKSIAEFITSVGPEIPWHISRFHPDYSMLDTLSTPVETLRKAKKIGESLGLRHVYLGNVFEGNNTYCYNCKALLIGRVGQGGINIKLFERKCPHCATVLDGVWM